MLKCTWNNFMSCAHAHQLESAHAHLFFTFKILSLIYSWNLFSSVSYACVLVWTQMQTEKAQEIPLPRHWDPMKGNKVQLVTLKPSSGEYKRVLQHFGGQPVQKVSFEDWAGINIRTTACWPLMLKQIEGSVNTIKVTRNPKTFASKLFGLSLREVAK